VQRDSFVPGGGDGGAFLGELFRYSFFRRLFFLLSGVALAFGCNVVRTTYLVRVCDLKGEGAVSTAHDAAGLRSWDHAGGAAHTGVCF